MNFDLKKLKKFFQKKGKKRGALMNPLRDWSAGLITAVIVFVVGVTMTTIDFYFQLVAPETPEVSGTPLVYRQNEVIEYAELYNEKTKEFTAARSSEVYIPPAPTTATTTSEEETQTLAEEVVDE